MGEIEQRYRSRYRGNEIDALLERALTALQPGALSDFLTMLAARELFVSKEEGKGLSTHDFTSTLKAKLEQLPTKTQLEEMLVAAANYRILEFVNDKYATRLTVPTAGRRYGLIVSYNDNGDHISEKYIATDFTDEEWKKDDNWTLLTLYAKPKRPVAAGVYILDTNGYYTPWREWSSLSDNFAVGVAVIDNRASFMIAPNDLEPSIWSNVTTNVDGIIASYDDSVLKSDYFGKANTDKVIAQLGDRGITATICRNYRFKNNAHGYCGGFGEWWVAFQYQSEVEQALVKMGGTAMEWYQNYWTSTQCPADHNWYFRWCHAEHDCCYRSSILRVRPFGPLPEGEL